MNERQSLDLPQDTVPLLDLSHVPVEEVRGLYTEAQAIVHQHTVTYGGLNTDVFYPQLAIEAEKRSKPLERSEIAPEEDEMLGLRIPHVWYFSQNPHNVGMAMHYINRQMRVLTTEAQDLQKEFGIVGIIECYKKADLQEFAKNNGYTIFSIPFDLVATAKYITEHIDTLDTSSRDKRYVAFIYEIIAHKATEDDVSPMEIIKKLAAVDEKTRRASVLKTIKQFWQTVLVARGIQPEDEDVILVDSHPSRPTTDTLDYTRSPFIVFVGGDMDNPSDSQIVVKNVALARAQYSPGTRIITPRYSMGDHYRYAALNEVNPDEITLDVLHILLLTIRELGLTEYEDLRRRYELLGK